MSDIIARVVHLAGWILLAAGAWAVLAHLPPEQWSGETSILILEAINRVAWAVAGVGMSLVGALGVYATRPVFLEFAATVVADAPSPKQPVSEPDEVIDLTK